jgi:anaerobic carbon-monoxide dehydrogenase iron sulfur subunit
VKRIVVEPSRCLACRTCEFACAMAHAENQDLVQAVMAGGAQPRIYLEAAGSLAVPLQCRHCEQAPCVQACPTGALFRADRQAPVLVDQGKCIGCEFCVQVCPFGVIRLSRDGKAIIKCDLCDSRLTQGLEPACVASCPVRALAFEEIQEDAARTRSKAAVRFLSGEGR